MTVYAKQYGRLGNNLFQKAAAIGYAMKHGLQYNLSPHLPPGARSNHSAICIKEGGHQYQELPTYKAKNAVPTILDGYWQSEKYFSDCREEVLNSFGFKWEPHNGWCSLHVRRGDYLRYPDKHPVVTIEYLGASMRFIEYKTGIKQFAVFSDDIQWCKDNFAHLMWTFQYSEARNETEDLMLGSCCEHNIISNSSFSWWQAWLNQNPNKVVVSPSKDNWFGPGNKHLDTSDLIPDSWIQIKY